MVGGRKRNHGGLQDVNAADSRRSKCDWWVEERGDKEDCKMSMLLTAAGVQLTGMEAVWPGMEPAATCLSCVRNSSGSTQSTGPLGSNSCVHSNYKMGTSQWVHITVQYTWVHHNGYMSQYRCTHVTVTTKWTHHNGYMSHSQYNM